MLQFIFQWDTDSVYKYKYYVCNVGNEMMTIDKTKNKNESETMEKKKIKRRKVKKNWKKKGSKEISIANKFILKCNLY